jgi:hypothetical protein
MYSLIIKDDIKEQDMLKCLASFFGVPKDCVGTFDIDRDMKEDILFESSAMRGDYSSQLCIYSKVVAAEKMLAMMICQVFNTEVLLSDDSLNPYSWIHVNGQGEEKAVYQRVDDPDEDLFLIKKP